ncbi:MAG: NADH-quinone oxidoreductase subunit F [Firmicutes bacterium]|nr:NADH-quinone oxidoreductase subunit F [Bacillota bacterium]
MIFPCHLQELAEKGKKSLCPSNPKISIGLATCGRSSGALDLEKKLTARQSWKSEVLVGGVGCLGACYAEPLVSLRTPDGRYYFYGFHGQADSNSLWQIIRAAEGVPSTRYLLARARERQPGTLQGIQDLELEKVGDPGFALFFKAQARRITGRCGLINPESLPEYVATGGYSALARALFQLQPEDVIAMVAASGLRGRGGAGFLTGKKWELASLSPDPERIVIANADEGDPGAYMDRALLESDPHSVLEGLILASYAVRASRAYVFVRHEYPLAVQNLRRAISAARAVGILGKQILGSGFSLEVHLVESPGAFVCGEETSMLRVMTGKRGEPYLRPPYPSSAGLWGHPTVVNNVETLANIPWIILHGPDAFREVGTEKSPGTKIFCLAGDVKRPGFIEVPLGTSTRAVIEEIGGAAPSSIKALQVGGPSGGIVPYSDFSLDYESVASLGAIMGSGGLVVLNTNRCLVDLARHLVDFMARESCGKCLFCRDGLAELEAMMTSLTNGEARSEVVLAELEELSKAVADMALCGLGKTAVNPVLTSLKFFREEYEAHARGKCPALTCRPLINFEIISSQCRDCRCCYLVCPTDAVKRRGGRELYAVAQEHCIKCRACYETCPFGCIKITSEGRL